MREYRRPAGRSAAGRTTAWPALFAAGAIMAAAPAPGTAADYLVAPVAAFESPPAGELEDIDAAVRLIRRVVLRDFLAARAGDTDALARRDAHAKHHGCVRATFAVRDDLPPAYAVGLFRPGARYDAWVRFSNASRADRADAVPDGRGMAIKVLGVDGPKLLDGVFRESRWFREERFSQDFVLINHPVFFVGDVRTYLEFTRAATSERLLPFLAFFAGHPREAALALEIVGQTVYDPLEATYHGMTPFLLGFDRAAKFSAAPVSCDDGSPVEPRPRSRAARDYLRAAMAEDLDPATGAAACFDFAAHVWQAPAPPPVEDATVHWDEPSAPRIPLATLRIEPQRFDTPGRMRLCEHLSMTPWHALPEHQPLGGLNRSRLHAYEAISRLRHWLNRAPALVPPGGR